jgi:hypothetical protein
MHVTKMFGTHLQTLDRFTDVLLTFFSSPEYTKDPRIKEVVTLTSDLSRKNLEKDFERMDTPQGTFYRVYFDIYLTLDGSEFNAELVCQGEVMGRCSARFR